MNEWKTYKKRPIPIKAIRWDNTDATLKLLQEVESNCHVSAFHPDEGLRINTLEGIMLANKGDYIICGVKRELYPCKPEIFEDTYDLVLEAAL